MSTAEQIYQAIRMLPVNERLKLIERVLHGLTEDGIDPGPAAVVEAALAVATTAGLLGAWTQDAALVGEVNEGNMRRE